MSTVFQKLMPVSHDLRSQMEQDAESRVLKEQRVKAGKCRKVLQRLPLLNQGSNPSETFAGRA
jgi:hypothetical protein